MSEEERESFVRPLSPRMTPDDELIELDLSEPAFGAQKKIGRHKRLVDRQVINSRTGSVKVKSLMDHQLYSPETTANGSDLLVASNFNNEEIIAQAMPVQNMGKTDSVPRGKWTTANQEFPKGIYLQLHVTAPQMMVLAEVATTSEQMQDKVATVTKFVMGFDDHADVSLFQIGRAHV